MLNSVTPFAKTILNNHVDVSRMPLSTLQVNIGKLCNQACHHCHVESSPKRTEMMDLKTTDRILQLLALEPGIHTVDITGGAPELMPHFKYFVSEIRALNKQVIDRCNLTVLFEKGQEETADFLAYNKVKIVASLPCYSKDNVEKQRGRGVFGKSIKALNLLNSLGYAKVGSDLELDLVYNPVGAHLPPDQNKLQQDYKKELKELFDIEFNRLYTITNMPIKRYLIFLQKTNDLEKYMQLLLDSFNPQAAEGIMCRTLVSVSYDGQIYDCDFNQMLEIPVGWKNKNIWEIDKLSDLIDEKIAFENHCYGCSAGAGSSCGGSLI